MKENYKNIIIAKNLVTGYGSGSRFKPFPAFPVNINASEGELIALIGVNGSGKTTLLKALSGLQPVKSGELLINGLNPQKTDRLTFARVLSIGTTEPIKSAYSSVFDFVSLGRFPYAGMFGKLDTEDYKKIDLAIFETGLENKKESLLNQLSDGEKQRAIIARTLSQDTPVILFDEPTAFLDIPNKFEILNTLKSLTKKHNKTIVFSTHDLQSALQLADRIWFISENGLLNKIPEQLIFDGDITKVFNTSHVTFDEDLTNFVFLNESSQSIGLTGDGRSFKAVSNALTRVGYKVVSNKKDGMYVILYENKDVISGQIFIENEIFEFQSIESLLLILHKN